MIDIIVNNQKYSFKSLSTYYDVANFFQKDFENDILMVYANGATKELRKQCNNNDIIEFIFYNSPVGREAYIRTGIFILFAAIYEVIEDKNGKYPVLNFTQSDSFYVSPKDNYVYTDSDLIKITEKYKELVSKKIKIEKFQTQTAKAIDFLKKHRVLDKALLFKYRSFSTTNYYQLNNYKDYYYDHLLYDTSYIKYYNIERYKDGIIISFPSIDDIKKPIDFKSIDKIFEIQNESIKWTTNLRVNTAGMLNEKIAMNEFNDLVILQEAFQEKKIGEISNLIKDSNKKTIFIAGPTSSGKTTFSHRLSYHLKSLGLNPITISVDNFFIDRKFSPRDENGEYDFESIENVDIKFLNTVIKDLLSHKEVELPVFNFVTGEREFHNDIKKMNENDILIFEGIHSLNDKMSYEIDSKDKFNIYISALTQISIDEHNRIPTSDYRLLRRIVRDNRTRGFDAKNTIKMWDKVQKGEKMNIFPYQENANVVFNSSLIYELPILKTYAEPLLFNIDKDTIEYETAKRLLKILSFFLSAREEAIPRYSVIREFIGGSILNVG